MSWVCDNCSCNNDDEANECFVCGERRSAESIRLARIKAFEKKREAFNDILYNKVSFIGKLWMIAAGVLCIVLCIIKIVQGTLLSDFEGNFRNILDIAKSNLQVERLANTGKTLAAVMRQKGQSICSFWLNFSTTAWIDITVPAVWSKLTENFFALATVLTRVLPDSVKFDAMRFLSNEMQSNWMAGMDVFGGFIRQGYDKMSLLPKTVHGLGNRIDGKGAFFDRFRLLMKSKYEALDLMVEYMMEAISNGVNSIIPFIKYITQKHTM